MHFLKSMYHSLQTPNGYIIKNKFSTCPTSILRFYGGIEKRNVDVLPNHQPYDCIIEL
jgi:hypothetical protein